MKFFLSVTFLVLTMAVAAQAQDKRLTIAVFDFDLPGDLSETRIVTQAGANRGTIKISEVFRTNLLTDKFITALVKSGRLSVVERSRMEEILTEGDMASSGIADPARSVKIGRLLGAQLLLFGTLENLEASVVEKKIPYTSRVNRTGKIAVNANIRIVDAETGQIRAAHSRALVHEVNPEAQGLQNRHFHEAKDKLVMDLTYLVLNEVFPVRIVHVQNNEVYIGQGSNSGVTSGERFVVSRRGMEIIDPDTGVRLGSSQSDIGIVEVVRVEPRMSIAKIVDLKSSEDVPLVGDICRPAPKVVSRPTLEEPKVSPVSKIFD
jgi:hypothetical protein